MSPIDVIQRSPEEKTALLDIEGTLTYGKRKLPEETTPEKFMEALESEVEGSEVEVGYWSGIHLLAGEAPSEYFERVEKWQNGEITDEEFEGRNIELWNSLLEKFDHESPSKFLDWYNGKFLDLRDNAGSIVSELQDQGYSVGLISHTSVSLTKVTVEQVGADFAVKTWMFDYDEKSFRPPEKTVYADEKAEILEELDGTIEEVLFIGNGANDVRIAEKADEGYLIENRAEVDYDSVDAFTGSFDEIMKKVEKQQGK